MKRMTKGEREWQKWLCDMIDVWIKLELRKSHRKIRLRLKGKPNG